MANLLATLIDWLASARRGRARLAADSTAAACVPAAPASDARRETTGAADAPAAEAAADDVAISPLPGVAGWFGKIPALGDFASRRLPEAFTTQWDTWLSTGIDAAATTLGTDWADIYRRRPPWRFLLAPDVIDAHAWFGVIVASADRVGRPFPLTVAMACQAAAEPIAALEPWWDGAARAVIDCQAQGATVEVLEDALTALGAPAFEAPVAKDGANDGRVLARIRSPNGLEQAFGRAAPLLLQALRGASFWWPCTDGADVVVLRGLPEPGAFSRLLDGSL
jgi:type VI secretion system protein ImpM